MSGSIPNIYNMDPSGDGTLMTLGTAQTVTGVKTFTVSPVMDFLTASQLVATDASKNLVSVDYTTTSTANAVVLRDASGNTAINNMLDGYTSTASTGGTTLMTNASTSNQYITGVLTHNMRLPNAVITPIGTNWVFKNLSTQAIIVSTFSTATLVTLEPGDDCAVICISNADNTVASWNVNYDNLASQLRTTGTPVNVYTAAPPTTGQVLTATSATAASWQSTIGTVTINTVSTTNATPAVISTIPTASNTTYFVFARIVAKTSTTGAGYELRAVYKNTGGVLAQISTDNKIVMEPVAGWDVYSGISGTNITLTVLGAAGTNIDWKCSWNTDSL